MGQSSPLRIGFKPGFVSYRAATAFTEQRMKVLSTSRYKTRLESGPEGRDSPKIGVQKWITLSYRMQDTEWGDLASNQRRTSEEPFPHLPEMPQSWVGDQPPPVYPVYPINKNNKPQSDPETSPMF